MRLGRAHPARDVERERPPRNRDDPGARHAREPRQDAPQEADADDRDRLPGLDIAARKMFIAQPSGSPGMAAFQRVGQRHHRVGSATSYSA